MSVSLSGFCMCDSIIKEFASLIPSLLACDTVKIANEAFRMMKLSKSNISCHYSMGFRPWIHGEKKTLHHFLYGGNICTAFLHINTWKECDGDLVLSSIRRQFGIFRDILYVCCTCFGKNIIIIISCKCAFGFQWNNLHKFSISATPFTVYWFSHPNGLFLLPVIKVVD